MKEKANIAILVMAAGESRRMSSIKQLLPWKGSTLLEHTIKTLKNVQEKSIYVVLGAYQKEIEAAINFVDEGVGVIENTYWKEGLGSSISCGVSHIIDTKIPFHGVLICLADQPLLESGYYKKIITELRSENNPIVASKYKEKFGVPALFDKSILSELVTLNTDYGAKHILSTYNEQITAVYPKDLIRDIDTKEQYLEIYHQYN